MHAVALNTLYNLGTEQQKALDTEQVRHSCTITMSSPAHETIPHRSRRGRLLSAQSKGALHVTTAHDK